MNSEQLDLSCPGSIKVDYWCQYLLLPTDLVYGESEKHQTDGLELRLYRAAKKFSYPQWLFQEEGLRLACHTVQNPRPIEVRVRIALAKNVGSIMGLQPCQKAIAEANLLCPIAL
jgi:hypothetical protein